MKVESKKLTNLINKFLEGGVTTAPEGAVEAAPAPEAAPEAAPAEGGDPMIQIAEAFAQGLQNQDCQLLAQAAQAFLELVGGGAPAEQAPGAPVYRRGGKLVRWS